MKIEIVGEIANIETIVIGGNIHDIMRLRKQFGQGRWRKLKGDTQVRLSSGVIRMTEFTGTRHIALVRRK